MRHTAGLAVLQARGAHAGAEGMHITGVIMCGAQHGPPDLCWYSSQWPFLLRLKLCDLAGSNIPLWGN